MNKNPWYFAGLHFECLECGNCCSGPGEGYIWVTRPEIEFIADFLKIPVEEVRQKYLKRLGLRTSIIEHVTTKDCIFLQTTMSLRGAERRSNLVGSQNGDCHGLFQRPRNDEHTSDAGRKKCVIYSVRPSQCRSWPFWSENLTSPNAWNEAATKCPGINRGRFYSYDEIQKIRKNQKWWQDAERTASSSEK